MAGKGSFWKSMGLPDWSTKAAAALRLFHALQGQDSLIRSCMIAGLQFVPGNGAFVREDAAEDGAEIPFSSHDPKAVLFWPGLAIDRKSGAEHPRPGRPVAVFPDAWRFWKDSAAQFPGVAGGAAAPSAFPRAGGTPGIRVFFCSRPAARPTCAGGSQPCQ